MVSKVDLNDPLFSKVLTVTSVSFLFKIIFIIINEITDKNGGIRRSNSMILHNIRMIYICTFR